MTRKSSGSFTYQKVVIVLFYASLLVFTVDAIFDSAARSFLQIGFSDALILKLRTIGTVLFILYYLLILPTTSPKRIFIPALCLISVTWIVSEVTGMICNMIPGNMVIGWLVGSFLLSLMGIFIIFVIPWISSLLMDAFNLFFALNALLISACFLLPAAANEQVPSSIRKKYKYYGYCLAMILMLTSGFWYSHAWCNGYYKDALKAMKAEDYGTAASLFYEVGSYKDARSLRDEMLAEEKKQTLMNTRTAGDEAMAAGDNARALEVYESGNLTFMAAKARAFLARQNGDLLSAADDLIYLLEKECYDLLDDSLELFRTHPELFTVGDTYYMGSVKNSDGERAPKKWLIVGEDFESFKLFSKDLLSPMPISEEDADSFADSDLYYYLNHDYLNEVFSLEEQKIMFKPADYYSDHPQEYQWPVMIPNRYEIDRIRNLEIFESILGKDQWLRDTVFGVISVSRGAANSVLQTDGTFGLCPQYQNRHVRPMIMIYK